jgi:hypothetical protein
MQGEETVFTLSWQGAVLAIFGKREKVLNLLILRCYLLQTFMEFQLSNVGSGEWSSIFKSL